eukprot:7395122-Pyramimonas_sp.AAC.1
MRRFNISLYTLEGATCLARTWCRKSQHYWGIYSSRGNDGCIFTDDDRASFRHEPTFLHLLECRDGAALARAQWLRDLRALQT